MALGMLPGTFVYLEDAASITGSALILLSLADLATEAYLYQRRLLKLRRVR